MTTHPKISVIITTYNRRQVLPRAIASVLAQDEQDFELIIVDDCSIDDTQSYLKSLADPRIRIFKTVRNSGPATARNLGLDAARGNIVALLDDDDIYLPRRLSTPLKIFASDPDVVCTLSSAIKVDLRRTQTAVMPELKLAPAAFEWALICDLIGVEGTSITVRRSAAAQIGGFSTDVSWIDDRAFTIRVSRVGSGYLIADTLWQKYWSDDSQSNQWAQAGTTLLSYATAHPDLTTRFRKIGSYLATKTLVADLRHGLFAALWRDWPAFKAAGLIDGNIARMWRDHREVSRYRRQMKSNQALAALTGPPDSWT